MDLKSGVNELLELSRTHGVLCAVRSILANLKVCEVVLDSLFKAEQIVVEKQVQLYDEVMRRLYESAGFERVSEGDREDTSREEA